MSEAVAKFTASAVTNFQGALEEFDKNRPVQTGGTPFLKLRKADGLWVYGQEQIEVEEGSTWMMGAQTFMKGWVDWFGGKPAGERMAYIGQPAVLVSELGISKGKKGWEEQVGCHLICMSGEDTGTEIIWKTNNHGGVQAWNQMFETIKARASAKKPYNPIVLLEESNYVHSEYGLIYKPVFNIQDWVTNEGGQDETEEKPKRSRKAKAEPPVAETEPVAEAEPGPDVPVPEEEPKKRGRTGRKRQRQAAE